MPNRRTTYEVFVDKVRHIFEDEMSAKKFAIRHKVLVHEVITDVVFDGSSNETPSLDVKSKLRSGKWLFYHYTTPAQLDRFIQEFLDHDDSFSLTIHKL